MLLLVDTDPMLYMYGAYQYEYVIDIPGEEKGYFFKKEVDAIAAASVLKLPYEKKATCPTQKESAQNIMRKLRWCMKVTGAEEAVLYVGKGTNTKHRRAYAPLYKMVVSRLSGKPPTFSSMLSLVESLHQTSIYSVPTSVVVSEEQESDDAIIKLACQFSSETERNIVVASVDKDLLYMHPGYKLNYATRGVFNVSLEQAIKNTCLFSLSGDAVDNIEGIHGIGEPEFHRKTGELLPLGKAYELYLTAEATAQKTTKARTRIEVYLREMYRRYKEAPSVNSFATWYFAAARYGWVESCKGVHQDTLLNKLKVTWQLLCFKDCEGKSYYDHIDEDALYYTL